MIGGSNFRTIGSGDNFFASPARGKVNYLSNLKIVAEDSPSRKLKLNDYAVKSQNFVKSLDNHNFYGARRRN